MKASLPGFCVAALLGTSLLLAADPPATDSLSADIDGLKAAAALQQPSGVNTLNRIANIQTQLDNQSYGSAIQMIQSASVRVTDPALRPKWDALLAAVKALQASTASKNEEEVKAFLQKVGQTCVDAKDSAALDPLYGEMEDMRQKFSSGGYSGFSIRLQNQLNQVQNLLSQWQNYLEAKSSGDLSGAWQALNNLQMNRGMYSGMPVDVSVIRKLQNDLTTAYLQQVADVKAAARKAIENAGTADDLNAVLKSAMALQNSQIPNNGNFSFQADISRVTNTLQRWQQILTSGQFGRYRDAYNSLSGLSGDSSIDLSLVPPAVVDRQMTALLKEGKLLNLTDEFIKKSVTDDVASIKSPADLDHVLGRTGGLASLTGCGALGAEISGLNDDLRSLIVLRNSALTGITSQTWLQFGAAFSDPWSARLLEIRRQLQFAVIGKAFRLPEDFKAGENEGVEEALLRYAREKAASRDWSAVFSALDALKKGIYQERSPAWLDASWEACSAWTQAVVLERNSQPAAAKAEYLKVIEEAPEIGPVSEAAKNLQADGH